MNKKDIKDKQTSFDENFEKFTNRKRDKFKKKKFKNKKQWVEDKEEKKWN